MLGGFGSEGEKPMRFSSIGPYASGTGRGRLGRGKGNAESQVDRWRDPGTEEQGREVPRAQRQLGLAAGGRNTSPYKRGSRWKLLGPAFRNEM